MNNKKEGKLMRQEKDHYFEPKLRFPEFRGAADWKFVPLNKLAKRCTQKNRSGAITRVLTNSAEYGVVDQRDYFDKDIATQGNLESYYVVDKGDYVYNPRISAAAPVGPISKNNVATGVMSPLYTVFRFGEINNDFYAYYFKTAGWHQYMRQASSTGARHDRMAITNDDFMAMPLPASTPQEQKKIADCIAALDECLDLALKKLDELNIHKQGLLQQLFPAEGETSPKLRFPGFIEAGEWTNEPLGGLAEIITGKTPSTTNSDLWDGDILFITPTDIGEDNKYQKTTVRTVVETKSTKVLPEGSIVYTCIASIGKMAITVRPSITNQQINAVVPSKKVLGEFMYYALMRLTPWIKTIPASNTLPIINKTEFSKISILYPADKNEQNRIATCLGTLDEIIAAQTHKVDELKNHKKGLMQQLFPLVRETVA
ncbi:restriction endonuclease subunit S [Comamonas thiooxydans]|uniref:restriction endonuclease subunit S n=1 Tax=Comamonas thiooxydans TaxID=363952 RepID=UPI003D0280CD